MDKRLCPRCRLLLQIKRVEYVLLGEHLLLQNQSMLLLLLLLLLHAMHHLHPFLEDL